MRQVAFIVLALVLFGAPVAAWQVTITHIVGSGITLDTKGYVHGLLMEFEEYTGYSVLILCNESADFDVAEHAQNVFELDFNAHPRALLIYYSLLNNEVGIARSEEIADVFDDTVLSELAAAITDDRNDADTRIRLTANLIVAHAYKGAGQYEMSDTIKAVIDATPVGHAPEPRTLWRSLGLLPIFSVPVLLYLIFKRAKKK